MVGNVKSHLWWCVSAFIHPTRSCRAIERVNHQEQIGRIEQAPALRCGESAVHLEPGAEGRECDDGHGMSQRKGVGFFGENATFWAVAPIRDP